MDQATIPWFFHNFLKIENMKLKTLIVSLVALMICSASYAQMYPVNWKKMKKIVRNDPEMVQGLIDRLSAEIPDSTLTIKEKVIAFYGQSIISGFVGWNIPVDLNDAFKKEDYKLALEKAQALLEKNPFNTRALFIASASIAAIVDSGDESYTMDDALKYYVRMMVLLDTIAATGNGDKDHPYYVVSIDNEYDFMRYYLELKGTGSQSVRNYKGHPFDVFELGSGSDYYARPEIWFEISRVTELENKLFGGL